MVFSGFIPLFEIENVKAAARPKIAYPSTEKNTAFSLFNYYFRDLTKETVTTWNQDSFDSNYNEQGNIVDITTNPEGVTRRRRTSSYCKACWGRSRRP